MEVEKMTWNFHRYIGFKYIWIWILRLFRDLSGGTKKPRREREREGDVTLMASGIIKIINIYHKKREGNKKKTYIYIWETTNGFSLSKKGGGNRKWRGNFKRVKVRSSARAAPDCMEATGHIGEIRSLDGKKGPEARPNWKSWFYQGLWYNHYVYLYIVSLRSFL